jgi:nucleotide-binding universal stress UspA family protein
MATIIITTDFSETARNALHYACSFSALLSDADILLVNIYTVPSSYSGDGVSLAAIRDSLGTTENNLKNELEWFKENYPGLRIRGKEVIGDFVTCLQQQIEEENAKVVVMGTPDSYGEIRLWDVDKLNALTKLSVPVLTVPREVGYKPIRNIAFACIFENINSHTPIDTIKKITDFTGARLHIVNVVSEQNDQAATREGENLLRSKLAGVNTVFHQIRDPHVIAAIGRYVAENQIDLLLVRPRRHGAWYNLFHKSYSKELAMLNLIPVIALHEN